MVFVDEDESCSSFNCWFLNNQVSQGKMERNSPVTMRTTGLGGSAWQCMRSVSCELQAAGGRLWHVGSKALFISFCPQSRFSVTVGPAPPVKQQEAGSSRPLFCGLWFRHTHFSPSYNLTPGRLRLRVYFRRGREGMGGCVAILGQGAMGFSQGLWSGCWSTLAVVLL